jgi:hypothetical protein
VQYHVLPYGRHSKGNYFLPKEKHYVVDRLMQLHVA